MRVAHLLRKYNPSEWGGTETAVKRLIDGLAASEVASIVFAPETPIDFPNARDPIAAAGHIVKRYRAFLPVARISAEQRRQLISVGGNLMSFDLLWKLLSEPNLSVIHTHALNRLAGVALLAARWRKIPLVVTIHGGWLDLGARVRAELARPLQGGFEWGKIFGLLLRSRNVLKRADAIVTCNQREAALLRDKYPRSKILIQPHAVPLARYQEDHRPAALAAFPELRGRQVLLTVGRIDPVKNQLWLIQQLPLILNRHPEVLLVLAGPCTDEAYGKALKKEIRNLGAEAHVLVTGGIPPEDPGLIGLLQTATVMVSPSLSETFGLTIVEAWAAGTAVICSRTSGASELISDDESGWLFDLDEPARFHSLLDEVLFDSASRQRVGHAGRLRAEQQYDVVRVARRMKDLYEQLIAKGH